MYDRWLKKYTSTNTSNNGYFDEKDYSKANGIDGKDIGVKVSSGASSFESILGIPSIDLTVKNRHSATGDGYPYEGSLLDNPKNTKTYLKFEQAEIIAKFLVDVIMQLVDSAKLDMSATAYANDVKKGIYQFLKSQNADSLAKNLGKSQPVQDLQHAADKFISVAQTFHSEAIPFPALRLLGDHEFNDQLLDLERAFLLPSFSTVHYQQAGPLYDRILSASPFRHLIHGPSPLNTAQLEFLPRLSAAIQIAEIENTDVSWKVVQKELFYVIDALESATCVLDNHLVYPNDK